MYRAGKAGNAAAVKYGFNPNSYSGNFERHLKSVMADLHEKRKFFYEVVMPGSARGATGRVEHKVHVFIPYE